MPVTRNAIIESTSLGIEDHGIFSFMLMMNVGDYHQGAGGYALDNEYGMAMIMEILCVVGVGTWEELVRKPIRIKTESGSIVAIGNLMKDEWLHFEDFTDVWHARKALAEPGDSKPFAEVKKDLGL